MKWLFLAIGLIVGAVFGVTFICLCIVSGEASRREEQALNSSSNNNNKTDT